MAKVSIFIRTYKRDIAWLDFCLQSIHANLKGWDEIVVAVPEGQEDHLRYLGPERRVTTPRFREDYVGQQVAKLQAHRHVTGDYIFFVDSDVIFLPGADVRAFLDHDKPVIGKVRYEAMARRGEAAMKWQAAVEALFGEKPEWEYMRSHGARLYRTDTLRTFEARFPDLEGYARGVPKRLFSEFNLLGYFAERHESARYRFVDADAEPTPPPRSRQFWTVDGLTPATLAELAALGFRPRWPSTLSLFDRFKRWLSQTNRRTKQRLKARSGQPS
jgi:glycosyltransferase involved in cell wall biosynthesis